MRPHSGRRGRQRVERRMPAWGSTCQRTASARSGIWAGSSGTTQVSAAAAAYHSWHSAHVCRCSSGETGSASPSIRADSASRAVSQSTFLLSRLARFQFPDTPGSAFSHPEAEGVPSSAADRRPPATPGGDRGAHAGTTAARCRPVRAVPPTLASSPRTPSRVGAGRSLPVPARPGRPAPRRCRSRSYRAQLVRGQHVRDRAVSWRRDAQARAERGDPAGQPRQLEPAAAE